MDRFTHNENIARHRKLIDLGEGDSARDEARHQMLLRLADTLDAVPYVTICNLANLNTALRGGLMDLIEVRLMCVGGGPTLDFQDAKAFLAAFQPVIDMALARRLN